jgi:hypothetical protein
LTGSVCPSVILLGIPCPGCGLTRAGRLLITGHFRESFYMHPLLIPVIIGILLVLLLKSTTRNYKLFINVYVIIILSAFIIFYLYRMERYFPDKEPMIYRRDNLYSKVQAILHYMKY